MFYSSPLNAQNGSKVHAPSFTRKLNLASMSLCQETIAETLQHYIYMYIYCLLIPTLKEYKSEYIHTYMIYILSKSIFQDLPANHHPPGGSARLLTPGKDKNPKANDLRFKSTPSRGT